MVNFHDVFPSKYLKAGDLDGKTVPVTISHIEMQEVGQGDVKPVMFFAGKEKGLVLNKTNGGVIAHRLGPEMDNWKDSVVEIYPDTTMFSGKVVDCIRLRFPIKSEDVEPTPF